MTITLSAGITTEVRPWGRGGSRHVLVGPKGAVTVERVAEADWRRVHHIVDSPAARWGFLGVGLHSPVPDQLSNMPMDCDLLDAGQCWGASLFRDSDEVGKDFEAFGEDGVWSALYSFYVNRLPEPEEDR
jgi:hypothetical protein